MNPLSQHLSSALVASNQLVALLVEENEGLHDEIAELEYKAKERDNSKEPEIRVSPLSDSQLSAVQSLVEHKKRIEVLGFLIKDCPLLYTTTQNNAELNWIKKANQVLSDETGFEFNGHAENPRRG